MTALIGDDCAVLPGNTLVSSDMLVEGRHFDLATVPLADLGWKAVAVNLSDIAAMGGQAQFLIINVGMPQSFSDDDFGALYAAMVECAGAFGCRIAGGDLTGGKQLTISITVIGQANSNGILLRSGAQAGDVVVASGDFGASAAGLWLLQNGRQKRYVHCLGAHLRPQPALAAGNLLVEIAGNRGAAMDTSDGLADALLQIAESSKVAITIDTAAIEIHEETRGVGILSNVDPLQMALYGGEDYQLVGCIAPQTWEKLQAAAENPFKKIGRVEAGSGVVAVDAAGKRLTIDMTQTYQHW